MQTITIDGFLSKDAEQRQTGGNTVTTWNVPVRQGFGDKEQTNWYRVSIWGKRADFAAKGMKGDFIVATGQLTIGEYNGKPQYEVNASDFTLRSAPRDDRERSANADRRQAQGRAQDGGNGGGYGNRMTEDEDSIPFARNDTVW